MKTFNVDNDVGDPIEMLANQEARSCGEIVEVLYRHLWIDLKVEFDMELQACLAGENLLHGQHTFRTQCHVPNSLNPLFVWHRVHQFIARVPDHVQVKKTIKPTANPPQ